MSVRRALAGRHLLITGATGFVGKVLLERILTELPETSVTVLVRGKGRQTGAERVGALLAHHPVFERVRQRGRAVLDRLDVWEASLDDLATPPARALDADLVLHLASRVDFEPTPAAALADNVHGARNIAGLAASTRGRRLLYVSTAYVAGLGARDVPEAPCHLDGDTDAEIARLEALAAAVDETTGRDLLRDRARALGFANGYTLTKCIAERLVADWPDLHSTLVRPAVIEAAWRDPYRGFHEGFRTCAPLTWMAVQGLVRIPARADLKLDLVPVDDVARGLLLASASALTDGEDGAVWQLGTSAVNPLTMDRLTEMVELAARRHGGVDGQPARPAAWLGIHTTGRATRTPGRLAEALTTASPWLGRWRKPARKAARTLTRVQRAADLFAPFILETDHAFAVDRALAATAALPDDERKAFGFEADQLDWRRWWLEAQYPGLQRHCYQTPTWDTSAPPWTLRTCARVREAG